MTNLVLLVLIFGSTCPLISRWGGSCGGIASVSVAIIVRRGSGCWAVLGSFGAHGHDAVPSVSFGFGKMSEGKVEELTFKVFASNVEGEVSVVGVVGAVVVLRCADLVTVVGGDVGDGNGVSVLVIELDVVDGSSGVASGVGDGHVDLGRCSVSEIVHEVAEVNSLDGIGVAVAVQITVFGTGDADGIGVVAGRVVWEVSVLPEVDDGGTTVSSDSPVIVSMEVKGIVVVGTSWGSHENSTEGEEEAGPSGELELALGVGLYFV